MMMCCFLYFIKNDQIHIPRVATVTFALNVITKSGVARPHKIEFIQTDAADNGSLFYHGDFDFVNATPP